MKLPVKVQIKQISKAELMKSHRFEEVLGYCQHCSNYNKNHSCPDFSFEAEALLMPFNYATIILTQIDSEPIRNNWDQMTAAMFPSRVLENYVKEDDEELPLASVISMFAFEEIKNQMADRLISLEKQFDSALSIPPGCCTRCHRCTKKDGKSCVYPEKLRYSLEALGFLVSDIYIRHFDLELGWASGQLPKRFCSCSVFMTNARINEEWIRTEFSDLFMEFYEN